MSTPHLLRRTLVACLLAISAPAFLACGPSPASDLTIERLPDVTPNIPDVPTLPPPPYAVTYTDGSYSVYGVRRREVTTIDTDLQVTGYIVEIYAPPVCPEDHTCPTPARPHLWIADARGVTEPSERLMIVGYAENQLQVDEAIELHERGRLPEDVDPTTGLLPTGLPPVPGDFVVGNKIIVRGHFARVASSGFNESRGLLEYASHTTVEAVTPPEE